jgi:hypothetical protein
LFLAPAFISELNHTDGMEVEVVMSGLEGTTVTAIGSAVIAFVASVATYSWKARGLYADLEKKLDKEIVSQRDEIIKLTGETMSAFRAKIGTMEVEFGDKMSGMELWNRDNFVRRSDFQNALDSLNRSNDDIRGDIKGLRAEIKEEIGRLNDLLIQLIQGKNGQPRA